ncbi:MAG: membrane protein insertion efficiency factor YidD [Gammaproteobacteria bacterium]|nr:MAG: membrane protein insertion efficiency factor YidD [Gammaproteobacteria bacterium]
MLERPLATVKEKAPSTPAISLRSIRACRLRNRVMRKLLLLPIRFYQYAISPLMASHCRHTPTCSQYAVEAITHHGAVKGTFLSVHRLLRCHPWAEGGYDPVPGTTHSQCDHSMTFCSQADHSPTTTQTRQ